MDGEGLYGVGMRIVRDRARFVGIEAFVDGDQARFVGVEAFVDGGRAIVAGVWGALGGVTERFVGIPGRNTGSEYWVALTEHGRGAMAEGSAEVKEPGSRSPSPAVLLSASAEGRTGGREFWGEGPESLLRRDDASFGSALTSLERLA